jgi:NTE family protein
MGRFRVEQPSIIDSDKPRKKVGIAFGGGGLKGSAHVGVLQVLSEHNIPIDFVAGTSIGSAVAALYASGYNWKMLDFLFLEYDIESLLKVRPGRKGLIPADGYTDLIRTCTRGKRIEEMDIPLKIVAVDLNSRKKIVFDRGDTATAVRASSAIPGIFTPVSMGDMLLVDGYILDNCPGRIVREMGADVVIAISLYAPNPAEPMNILDIVHRSLDVAAANCQRIEADIILRPIKCYVDGLKAEGLAACRQWGEDCARAQIDEIIRLVGE